MRYLFILFFIPTLINAQFFESKSQVVYGINLGTHISNNETGEFYNGFYNSPYDINWMLSNNSLNNNLINILNQRLNSNWEMQNVPAQMKYRPGLEVGLHVGIQKEKTKFYLDYNFVDIKAVGEFFFVESSSNSNLIDLENILASVIGEERRSFFNLGLISELISENEYHLGLPLFFQINQTKFKTNYIIVENQKYVIPNPNLGTTTNQNNINQVGSGFGLGTGLVGTIALNESINFSVAYHLQYSNIKITNDFNNTGLQNSLIARIIWNKE